MFSAATFVAGALAVASPGIPSFAVGGMSFDSSGNLCVSTRAPDSPVYLCGLPFTSAGELVCIPYGSRTLPVSYQAGMAFDKSGALLVVTSANAVAPKFELNGLLFDANGALVVSGSMETLAFNAVTAALHSLPQGFAQASRATNATTVDSQGRLVWAPANFLWYSETAAQWTTSGAASTAAGVTPPSTASAVVRVQATEGTSNHMAYRTYTSAESNRTYTASVYVLLGNTGYHIVGDSGDSAWHTATIDAYSGAVTATTGLIATPTVEFLNDGWMRVSVSFTRTNAGNINVFVCPSLTSGATQPSYTATGAEYGYYTGLQLEHYGVDTTKPYIATQGAAYYGNRYSYNPITLANLGLFLEEGRTNSIRNSWMIGAAVGANPTNWVMPSSNGISQTVVGVGVEDGIPYVDVRYSGTASASSTINTNPESPANISASSGQTWTGSMYIKYVSGTPMSVTNGLQVYEGNPGYLAGGIQLLTSTWNNGSLGKCRVQRSYTLVNGASTGAAVQAVFSFALNDVVDLTIRIGMPQMELGSFQASSPIPTVGAVGVRGNDSAPYFTPIPGYNAGPGTFLVEFSDVDTNASGAFPVMGSVAVSNGVDYIQSFSIPTTTTTSASERIDNTSVQQTSATIIASLNKIGVKHAIAWSATDVKHCANGSAVQSAAAISVPVNLTHAVLGKVGVGAVNRCRSIKRMAYWPTQLTNAQIQALTT